MKSSIKKLAQSDSELFKQLLQVFQTVFAGEEEFGNPSDQYLDDLLKNPYFIVYVAVKNDQVIGGLTAYELPKYHTETSEVYIYDLAVLNEYQRQGIGSQLIEHLKNDSINTKRRYIFVQADKGDSQAENFYRKTGAIPEDVTHFDYILKTKK